MVVGKQKMNEGRVVFIGGCARKIWNTKNYEYWILCKKWVVIPLRL